MDELVELLWDRGTVVVQGQSSRPPSADTGTGYSYKAPSFGDGAVLAAHDQTREVKKMLINKDAAGGNPAQIMQFDDDSPEPLLDPEFFSLPDTEPMDRPECDVRVVADADADADTGRVPWIDYPILDSSSDHHCTGNKAGELPPSNLLNSNPPLPPPSLPPKTADVRAAGPVHKPAHDINNVSCSAKKPPHLHLEGGGLGVGLVNFSHFLRPVALAEATLQSAERLRSNEKASTSYNNSSRLESIVIQSASTLQPPAKPTALPKPQMPLPSIHQKEVGTDTSNHYRDGNNNQATPPSLHPAQRTELDRENKERQKAKEQEKNVQQALEAPPASVCSINVNPKQKLKRKSLEEDNATNSDEDVQDESVGLTRSSTSKSKGIKRGRTAEVHNLSERRRRDRINEKMRALQELIPNCNKVDKASMLDEAIEYLKTLQLQVQMMMMMGNGMCIPPMMVPPPGLHHMPLAAYPQIGMGMGLGMGMNMGMGYGIGMAPAVGGGDMINHHHPVIRTPHLAPPMNFMPVINGAVFPFDNGIPPPAPSFGPQVERRHGNSTNAAQSGEVEVNRTDTGNNGETVKLATRSWS